MPIEVHKHWAWDPPGKRQVPIMISSGFGVLALFSLLSALFGGDRRGTADPTRSRHDAPTSWFDPLA